MPALGDLRAHQFSFITGSILVLGIATIFVRWLQASRASQLLGVGLVWLLLTVVFEIVLGRFIFACCQSGHLALQSGIAGGADVILIPEISYRGSDRT